MKVKKRLSTLKRGDKKYADVEDWGEVYKVCCPACGDTRFRLFFSHMCGSSLTMSNNKRVYFSNWIFDCKNEKCRVDLKQYIDRLSEMDSPDLSKVTPDEAKVANKKSMCRYLQVKATIPYGMVALSPDNLSNDAFRYLLSRELDPMDLMVKYNCRLIPKGAVWKPHPESGWTSSSGKDYIEFREPRLFIPIIQSRRIVSWQARLLREDTKKDIKYLTMPETAPCIYNFDSAIVHDNILVVEGVVDVWKTGSNSIALLGSTIADEQLFCLKAGWGMTGKGILVVEEGAENKNKKSLANLQDQGIFPEGILLLSFGDKDPGDLDHDYIQEVSNKAFEIMPVEDPTEILTADEVTEIYNKVKEVKDENTEESS